MIPTKSEKRTVAPQQRGVFITFEGGEGVGKSTQINFLAEHLRAKGLEVLTIREPGGTPIGEAIRAILLDPANTAMSARAELLLYEASRAQLVTEVIEPALAAGKVVLCDRFYDSTYAYQGVARGLGVECVSTLNGFACDGLEPDRTIVLTLGVDLGLERATNEGADRLERESRDFHERVHGAFRELHEREPERIRIVPTREFKQATFSAILDELEDLLPR